MGSPIQIGNGEDSYTRLSIRRTEQGVEIIEERIRDDGCYGPIANVIIAPSALKHLIEALSTFNDERPLVTVISTKAVTERIALIKEAREASRWGLKEAKDLLVDVGSGDLPCISHVAARRFVDAARQLGAVVMCRELEPPKPKIGMSQREDENEKAG